MTTNSHLRYFFGLTAAGAGTPATVNQESAKLLWGGGKGSFKAWGTWTGPATITLRMYPDDNATAPIDVDPNNAVLTKDGGCNFDLEPCNLAATITGGSAGMSLTATISKR